MYFLIAKSNHHQRFVARGKPTHFADKEFQVDQVDRHYVADVCAKPGVCRYILIAVDYCNVSLLSSMRFKNVISTLAS